MCQYDTDAPAQGHPHLHEGILFLRVYKIWIQYTNLFFFFFKYRKENIF